MSHSRLPCPPLIPRVCLSSRSRSQWCCLTISSSVTPFSFCLQSFPRSGSFPTSWLLPSRAQSIGSSVSVNPSSEYLGLISMRIDGFISLQSKELSKVFSITTIWKHQFIVLQPSLCSNSHIHTTTGKTIALTRRTFVSKVMSLLFNTLSKFVIAFLKRSKNLYILWLQSLSKVILEPKKMKSIIISTFCLSICYEVMRADAIIFVFWMLNLKLAFSLSSFTFIRRLFGSSLLSAIKVVSSAYLRLLIFFLAMLILACESSSPAFHLMHSAK